MRLLDMRKSRPTVEDCIAHFELNSNNASYLERLALFIQEKKPSDFLKEEATRLGFSRPVAKLQISFWRIRGYDEDESKQKVSEVQSRMGSFEYKKAKMIASGMSEEEAEEKIREMGEKRSRVNSESHKRAQEKDPSYLKSMSHQCKEFWMKKGFPEEEAVKKAAEVCERNRKKFRKKLDSGEIEKGWNNTTIEYYLRKGMTVEEAKRAVIDRQVTFSLEKCIEKYGEEKGKRIWEDRQKRWKAAVFNDLQWIGGGKSRVSMELFEKLGENEALTGKSERFMRKGGEVFKYDFCLRDRKKIIEFNGDFWHCDPRTYSADYFHKIKQMTAQEIWDHDRRKEGVARSKGYDYLVVWEADYKRDPVSVIQKCKEFLR